MNHEKIDTLGMSLEEVIRKAIGAEEHGHRFYKAQAEASVNPLAKALLEELSEDELRHSQWFTELGHEAAGGSFEPYVARAGGSSTLEERLKAVFGKMDESARGKTDRSQEEILKEAIRLEKESYTAYDEAFKSASGAAKEFFDRMRREEYEHLTALENTLTYLTKTGMWFDIEESKRWNWMNI